MHYPEFNVFNSIVTVALGVINCLLIFREMCPSTQLKYSKFSLNMTHYKNEKMIPSFYGMLLIYSPSMLVCFALVLNSLQHNRLCLISIVLFLHYCKRVLEVLFVHRYSGSSKLIHNCIISTSYVTFSVLVYTFSAQVKNPKTSSMFIGTFLFFVGEYINFYHHRILSQLRQGGSKEYRIPSAGLFKYSWCPHYVGEIVSFLAIVLITQHFYILILQMGSSGYLVARAYNTKQWYKQKFGKIPERACLLPFIF